MTQPPNQPPQWWQPQHPDSRPGPVPTLASGNKTSHRRTPAPTPVLTPGGGSSILHRSLREPQQELPRMDSSGADSGLRGMAVWEHFPPTSLRRRNARRNHCSSAESACSSCGRSRGRGVAARRVLRKHARAEVVAEWGFQGADRKLRRAGRARRAMPRRSENQDRHHPRLLRRSRWPAEEGDRPGAQHQSRVRGRRTALTNVVVFLSAHTKTVGPGATAPDPPWFVQATQKSCVTPDSVPW
jgi:hypothetical protein